MLTLATIDLTTGVDDAGAAACAALLDADERTRAMAFRVDAARRQYVVAHALARLMLSEVVPRPPAAWSFARGPHGKPAVVGHPTLRFNLSHTDGRVACGVSTEAEAGVDVEASDRRVHPHHFTAFLSPTERETLTALRPAERGGYFFDVWTAKEAYLKARGTGLRADLPAITVRDASSSTPHVVDAAAVAGDWHLRRWALGRHTLVLASAAAIPLGLCPRTARIDAWGSLIG